MILKKHATMLAVAVTVILTGCVASDTSLETAPDFVPEPVLAPEVLAALAAPCEAQMEFQVELNGNPDDTLVDKSTAFGKTITEERYWYADASTSLSKKYACRNDRAQLIRDFLKNLCKNHG